MIPNDPAVFFSGNAPLGFRGVPKRPKKDVEGHAPKSLDNTILLLKS